MSVALFSPLWTWLQASSVAMTVANSTLLTGVLSGLHVVGMTLLAGSVVVTSLRLMGMALTTVPVSQAIGAPVRGVGWGLMISIVTGALLFAARAPAAAADMFFRWKMGVLAAALLFHFGILRGGATSLDGGVARLQGMAMVVLWFAVVGLGCAYILLE